MTSNKMKVAIVGSNCVGKTVLCKNLHTYFSKQGFSVGLTGEIARESPFPINEMSTIKSQDWILKEQRKREKELIKKCDIVLADRGVIDNYAYWFRVAEIQSLDIGLINQKEKEIFDQSETYNAILFIQLFEIDKIEDDKVRSISPEWREEMHNRVSSVLNRFKENYNTPVFNLEGNKQEVFEQAKNILENSLHSI